MTSTLDANKRHEFAMETTYKVGYVPDTHSLKCKLVETKSCPSTRDMGSESNSGGHCFCMYCRPGEGTTASRAQDPSLGVVWIHVSIPGPHAAHSSDNGPMSFRSKMKLALDVEGPLRAGRQAESCSCATRTGDSLAQA